LLPSVGKYCQQTVNITLFKRVLQQSGTIALEESTVNSLTTLLLYTENIWMAGSLHWAFTEDYQTDEASCILSNQVLVLCWIIIFHPKTVRIKMTRSFWALPSSGAVFRAAERLYCTFFAALAMILQISEKPSD
jgi:hypothetical protein